MVSRLTPRNVSQRLNTFDATARLVSTATVWYTCPTGKRAHFKGYMIPDAFGAGTLVRCIAAGLTFSPDLLVLNVQSELIEGDLEAGETLGYTQDTGSNATVDGIWSIIETPA